MKFLIFKTIVPICTLFALTSQADPINPVDVKSSVRNDAEITDVPYIAQIRRVSDGGLACSGAIFNFLYILTTASCVHEHTAESLTIFVGSSNLIDGTSYAVSEIKIHEEFDVVSENRFNDIAMLKIAGFMRYGTSVRPIEVPETWDDETFDEGSNAVMTGWGNFSTLREVDQIIESAEQCKESYANIGKTITDDFICTKNEVSLSDGISENESGSPLVQNSVLIGLKSWKISGYPDVSTRVYPHRYWIDENNTD